MKDRSLEEIDEMFEKRVPAWEFAGYECECSKQAHQIVMEQKLGKHETNSESAVDKKWTSANVESMELA